MKGVSRSPAVALMQKQNVPDAPRPKGLADAPITSPPAVTQEASLAQTAKAAFQALRQFETNDYLNWIREYLRNRFGPRHEFQTYEGKQPADGIYPLSGSDGEVRMSLAGDWGTGTDEAYRVAHLMSKTDPHYTIHLGDVYFVGDAVEVSENFLGKASVGSSYTPCQWPYGSQGSFALNGNHEMYARGIAYFDAILPALGPMLNGKPQKQLASYFCLKNDAWCVLGLDTGYNSVGIPGLEYFISPDARLPEQLVSWLESIAPKIEHQSIVILTHHQVLSIYDDCFLQQADQIFRILKRPVLWFWGHEHRLAIYEPYDGSSRGWPAITGRCIGHGGMPVDLPGKTKVGSIGKGQYVDRRLYKNDEQLHVGINGFAQLTFNDARLRVEYVDVYGQTVLTERFTAEAGSISSEGIQNVCLTPP